VAETESARALELDEEREMQRTHTSEKGRGERDSERERARERALGLDSQSRLPKKMYESYKHAVRVNFIAATRNFTKAPAPIPKRHERVEGLGTF